MNGLERIKVAIGRIPCTFLDFPQVAISERQRLPELCAVYLVLKRQQRVLYVGFTRNLHHRWKRHDKYPQVVGAGATHIAWLPQEDEFVGLHVETHCICHFQPPFNTLPGSYYTGGNQTVKLTEEELSLVEAFAKRLTCDSPERTYSTEEALRIAALRYLRGGLFYTLA